MPGTRVKHRRRRAAVIIALTFVVTFAIGRGVAQASATSGMVFWSTQGPYYGGSVDFCLAASINDIAYNESWIVAYRTPAGCGGSLVTMPAGWIGVNAHGFRDGAYCGSTGPSYNSLSIPFWAVGGYVCSNPSGTQSFFTFTVGSAYAPVGGTLQWVNGLVASPTQNY